MVVIQKVVSVDNQKVVTSITRFILCQPLAYNKGACTGSCVTLWLEGRYIYGGKAETEHIKSGGKLENGKKICGKMENRSVPETGK